MIQRCMPAPLLNWDDHVLESTILHLRRRLVLCNKHHPGMPITSIRSVPTIEGNLYQNWQGRGAVETWQRLTLSEIAC